MSPGRRKIGIFTGQGQRSRTAMRAVPAMIRIRYMAECFSVLLDRFPRRQPVGAVGIHPDIRGRNF
jgi:hypothetical protein